MKTTKLKSFIVVLLCTFAGSLLVSSAATAQSAKEYRMTTPIAPGVATPDTLESSIGTLNLNYGYPTAETVEKIYDNLDRSRALQAYLLGIPIVNQASMRDSLRKFGPDNQTDVVWENLVDPNAGQGGVFPEAVADGVFQMTIEGQGQPLLITYEEEFIGSEVLCLGNLIDDATVRRLSKEIEKLFLSDIVILELVDHDVAEPLFIEGADLRIGPKDIDCQSHHIREGQDTLPPFRCQIVQPARRPSMVKI